MDHIASISYGKDSLAMLEVIAANNIPLDRIVHVEIMATPDIPADLPEVMEWKQYADNVIVQRYGIKFEPLYWDILGKSGVWQSLRSWKREAGNG